jgi:hypothetical protein
VRILGLFQDGGLQHNNPASIAQWETRFVWPNKSEPDFALSLGTGTSSIVTECGAWSKSRFYVRLFKSFMRNIDGEDAWRRFYNSLTPDTQARYYRLNIPFSGPEPGLDDAPRIPDLKASVLKTIESDSLTLTAVKDSMIASMFYFELDSVPELEKGVYICSGYIFCRLDMPASGLRMLYQRLVETSSWFLIQGSPIRCVQSVPKSLPPFKRRITFSADSLDEVIEFSIRGVTSTLKMLSGFPTSLTSLITDQRLDSPFGTIDHALREKPLPAIPKRRHSDVRSQESRRVSKRPRR